MPFTITSLMTSRRRAVLAVAAVMAATAVGATAAFGAGGGFTDASGHINACVAKVVGTVRIVEPGAACNPNEDPLAWNERGPAGGARTLVAVDDSATYDEPTNRVRTPDDTWIQVGAVQQFTLADPTFVTVLSAGQMTSTDGPGGYGSCDGSIGMGPSLALMVDNRLYAGGSNILNPGPGYAGQASANPFRLSAGTHTLTWQYFPYVCETSASGTTHVGGLSATVVSY
jgi:hypothetical protein